MVGRCRKYKGIAMIAEYCRSMLQSGSVWFVLTQLQNHKGERRRGHSRLWYRNRVHRKPKQFLVSRCVLGWDCGMGPCSTTHSRRYKKLEWEYNHGTSVGSHKNAQYISRESRTNKVLPSELLIGPWIVVPCPGGRYSLFWPHAFFVALLLLMEQRGWRRTQLAQWMNPRCLEALESSKRPYWPGVFVCFIKSKIFRKIYKK